MIRAAHPSAQQVMAQNLVEIFKQHPDQSESVLKEGMIIPSSKKSDRKDLANHLGVCLLAMRTRIIARVMVDKLREWSESLELLGA